MAEPILAQIVWGHRLSVFRAAGGGAPLLHPSLACWREAGPGELGLWPRLTRDSLTCEIGPPAKLAEHFRIPVGART